MSRRILIVDDEPLNLDRLSQELADLGHVTENAASGADALKKMRGFDPELIFLDYQMPGMNGIEVLREIRRQDKNLPVIIITAYGTIERAVEAIKTGADDFITKPFDPEHLAVVVKKALERAERKSEVEFLARELGGRYRLIAGESKLMAQAVEEAKKAANSKSTVLLLGESGTGKEIFARSIHEWSDRKSRPFVPINCVGLSKELLESELFGHEKGAFTGAQQLKRGKMEMAPLADCFLQRFSSETKKVFSEISADARQKLLDYHWPGNVRELANVLERAVVLGDGPTLTLHHLPSRVVGHLVAPSLEGQSYHDAVNNHRRQLILDALTQAQGNRAAAAKALGLHRTHLMKLMKALQIR